MTNLECLIKKISGSKNNLEELSSTKVSENIPSVSKICEFYDLKNKQGVYRGKDCVKNFVNP